MIGSILLGKRTEEPHRVQYSREITLITLIIVVMISRIDFGVL